MELNEDLIVNINNLDTKNKESGINTAILENKINN